jgi:uncharacterized protein (DUF924 family)
MESLARSKAVIELGKRLAATMAEDEDLTAEWMAHLVAERILAAEHAPPDARGEADDACARAILNLWEHRYAAPPRFNPLRDAEPVMRTLASLDSKQEKRHFFPEALEVARAEDCKNPNDWLKLALQLDRAARDLIEFAIRSGAEDALASDEFRSALSAAMESKTDVELEIQVVRFVLEDGTELGDDSEFNSREQDVADRIALEKIERLERFAELAQSAATRLKARRASSSSKGMVGGAPLS